jgi:hypothetical protein
VPPPADHLGTLWCTLEGVRCRVLFVPDASFCKPLAPQLGRHRVVYMLVLERDASTVPEIARYTRKELEPGIAHPRRQVPESWCSTSLPTPVLHPFPRHIHLLRSLTPGALLALVSVAPGEPPLSKMDWCLDVGVGHASALVSTFDDIAALSEDSGRQIDMRADCMLLWIAVRALISAPWLRITIVLLVWDLSR